MYIARIGSTAPFIVIDVDNLFSGIPSNNSCTINHTTIKNNINHINCINIITKEHGQIL